jgi:hypothetical protein
MNGKEEFKFSLISLVNACFSRDYGFGVWFQINYTKGTNLNYKTLERGNSVNQG